MGSCGTRFAQTVLAEIPHLFAALQARQKGANGVPDHLNLSVYQRLSTVRN